MQPDHGSTAYTSYLSIGFGPSGEPERPWLTATATDRNDGELREIRRRLVDPVVGSLFSEDELEQLTVFRDGGEVGIWISAGGEEFHDLLVSPPDALEREPASVAARLADHLEDWVCETRFGWGQQRIAHYVIPPA